ncbi:hypothetical protein O181_022799 [Austropuccinia psidii MF-1]|uniref:Uncharacterized protein n=1 Tax=Austropuccinia psidii MF-1 TaxID=1389203 RepID=A0A9Q3GY23_9BASI|nr:hypothetical protein [Austropuccinia psidii MF-1]
MQDFFNYSKERCEKIYRPPDFKIGDLVLVVNLKFNNIKVPNKLKDSFAGPFMMKALHGPNAVHLELTGELMNKHPAFPVIIIKTPISSDKELFPPQNKPPCQIFTLEEGGEKKIVKVLNKKEDKKQERKQIPREVQTPSSKI